MGNFISTASLILKTAKGARRNGERRRKLYRPSTYTEWFQRDARCLWCRGRPTGCRWCQCRIVGVPNVDSCRIRGRAGAPWPPWNRLCTLRAVISIAISKNTVWDSDVLSMGSTFVQQLVLRYFEFLVDLRS